MARGKAEDAGGLTPAKDDNAAPYHFAPRTLPTFMCVDYTPSTRGEGQEISENFSKNFTLHRLVCRAGG